MRKPTIKQRKFVKKYLEIGNGTQAALETYDTNDRGVAQSIATENLSKPVVQQLLESQASVALLDQIDIRQELKESQKDYAVRCKVNIDILDRAGYGSNKEQSNVTQINVFDPEQARRLASRILQRSELNGA